MSRIEYYFPEEILKAFLTQLMNFGFVLAFQTVNLNKF